ncbi:MAG: beta-ketoacyl-ACP synthase II [Candidatus Hydrogenedentes bacterium]|nr:beta-ketoacyl-ACP synthase II [Candidatus Hydrogenedentota bacterium]MBI3118691.1 beta-ketoacyl-ACP synthase II [Candidatus Hydrogenedentota bacterium]
MTKRIVITGMGIVSPLGNDVESFWKGLCKGRSGIRPIEHLPENNGTPTKIAGMSADVTPEGMGNKDLRRHSRYTLFAVESAQQAWKQSGLDLSQENPFRCGVVFGSGIGGIECVNEDSVRMAEGGWKRISPLMIPRGLTNMAAGVISIQLGLQGPNKAIVTACATGTQCIGEAADMIRLGKADVMLAGGAEATIIPFGIGGFNVMKALSTRNEEPERASRPFDLERDGFVMGEGAGCLVLESEEHAKARGAAIFGEVLGMGETCDAYHITAPRPDGSGPAAAMRAALTESQLIPADIDYYNAHGTSTKLNDASECLALKNVFGEETPPVSSIKSMIGHLLGAAGAVEAISCVLAIRDKLLPPNINYETPDPECDVNIVANQAWERDISTAMSSSLGFGGHNAAIILRRYV